MTLMAPLHAEFGEFRLALEATDTLNQYHIKVFRGFSSFYANFLPESRIVTFLQYPLPSPILLQVHAAIANVLNATGRGELIENFLRKYGDAGAASTRSLAKDGSTDIAQLLSVSPLSVLASRTNRDVNQLSLIFDHLTILVKHLASLFAPPWIPG
jgi:hypothetical protein